MKIVYFLITLSFLACHNNRNYPAYVSTEKLDTIVSSPVRTNATPVVFETAFIKGTKGKINKSTVGFYGITIGKLKIVSGHIIACDPLHIDEYGIPFTQVFPTGEFPVQLSVAGLGNEEVIAFARISFSEEPVAKWEFALQKGQAPLPVGGDEKYGYSVDGGIGIFMDYESSKVLDKTNMTDLDAKPYKEMDKHSHYGWRYGIYSFGSHNMAEFTSGFGDGRYATYIGFDANGKPCRLLTDFGLIDWKTK